MVRTIVMTKNSQEPHTQTNERRDFELWTQPSKLFAFWRTNRSLRALKQESRISRPL